MARWRLSAQSYDKGKVVDVYRMRDVGAGHRGCYWAPIQAVGIDIERFFANHKRFHASCRVVQWLMLNPVPRCVVACPGLKA